MPVDATNDTDGAKAVERARVSWLTAGVVVTALALGAAGITVYRFASNSEATSIRTQHSTYASGISSLVVDIDYGDVRVVAHQGSAVSVERRSGWKNNRPQVESHVRGSTLTLSSRCSDSSECEVDYAIEIPAGTTVRTVLRDGDVSATGIRGALAVENGAGDVDIAQAGGAVHVSTWYGDITATELRSDQVDASTQDGDVRLGFTTPPTTARATSSDAGDVRVTLPRPGADAVAYRVKIRASIGEKQLAVANDASSSRTISARAVSGDVSVEYG